MISQSLRIDVGEHDLVLVFIFDNGDIHGIDFSNRS